MEHFKEVFTNTDLDKCDNNIREAGCLWKKLTYESSRAKTKTLQFLDAQKKTIFLKLFLMCFSNYIIYIYTAKKGKKTSLCCFQLNNI